jgi:hypothetical protein
MFSAIDGFRFIPINVANGYIATFADTNFFTSIPTSDGNTLRLSGSYRPSVDDTIIYVALNNTRGARIIAEKTLGNATVTETGLNMATIPSSNSTILVGQNNLSAYITYLDSNNAISWQKQISTSLISGNLATYRDVSVESGGANIYASGSASILISGSPDGINELVKYNSSGTILSQNRVPFINALPIGIFSADIKDLEIDSANNLYITGTVPQSLDGNTTYVTGGSIRKQSSNGAFVWDAGLYLANNTGNVGFKQSIVDSANNVYTIGSSTLFPFPEIIAKFDGNGVLSWQKQISNVDLTTLTTDSTGNVYVAGRLSPDLANSLYFSLDSNTGNINWQNFIYSSASNVVLSDINYANNFLYTGGYTQPSNIVGLAMKLPSNGTGTGQHGAYNISTGNISISTSTLDSGGANFQFISTSYANSTPTLSIQNGPVPRRVIPL